MNANELLFNQAFNAFGGKYDYSLNEYYRIYFQNLQKNAFRTIKYHQDLGAQFPEVHIDFINDFTRFNACASKKNDLYFIGINACVPFLLLRYFNYIFSHSNLYRGIGDSSTENSPPKILIPTSNDYYLINFLSNLDDTIKPLDEVRSKSAEWLTLFSFVFLVGHELGHIYFGHLDLYAKENLANKNFMFEINNMLNDGNLNYQTLEMDADSYAAKVSLNLIINIFNNYKDGTEEFLIQQLQFLAYSILMVFNLFSNKLYDQNNLDKYKHPPVRVRLYFILSVVYTILLDSPYEKVKKYYWDAMKSVMEECNETLAYLTNENKDYCLIRTKEEYYQVYKIQSNWEIVRKQLEPFSFGKLAPIEKLDESMFKL